MSKSKIEWTEQTWNPIGGCGKVSPGCKNCYAIRNARRMQGSPIVKIATRYAGMTVKGPNWSGETFIDDEVLREPLKRRIPTTYFISLSDLFYDARLDAEIDRVFAVMALCPQHRFLVLTKYQERMQEYFKDLAFRTEVIGIRAEYESGLDRFMRGDETGCDDDLIPRWQLPFSNVGLGVSVEDQQHADERIPVLLQTPAAMRFVSAEPLLGPIDLFSYLPCSHEPGGCQQCRDMNVESGIDWVIAGFESGPGARWTPGAEAIALSLRDQCQSAGVPFFFKQWGEYLPPMCDGALIDGHQVLNSSDQPEMVGKKAAGALLDGREWRELPKWLGEAA